MKFLRTLDSKFFHDVIPAKPMGKYVHLITIRVTESYPLFQTDGELNKARVRAGIGRDRSIILPSSTPGSMLTTTTTLKWRKHRKISLVLGERKK